MCLFGESWGEPLLEIQLNLTDKKALIILGAGVYQVPLIEKAKACGYSTHVCSVDGDYPGFEIADHVYKINIKSTQEVLQLALKINPVGICSSGSEVCLPALAAVNEQFQFPGLSSQAAALGLDKWLMRTCLARAGCRQPVFHKVNLGVDLQTLPPIKSKHFLKCVNSSGSRGIVVVENKDELEKAIIELSRSIPADQPEQYLILEEEIVGDEFGAQAIIYKGEISSLFLFDDVVYKYREVGIPIAHCVPIEHDSKRLYEAVLHEVSLAAKAMKLDNCFVNVDLKRGKDLVTIIEISGRSGGTLIPELFQEVTGVDVYQLMIDLAIGEVHAEFLDNVRHLKLHNSVAVGILFSEIDQTLDRSKAMRHAKNVLIGVSNHEAQVDLSIDGTEDTFEVKKLRNGTHRFGSFILRSSKTEPLKLQIANSLLNA